MRFPIILILLAGMLTSLAGADDFRIWKISNGGHFEAKLKSVSAQKVTLQNREGKVIDFPTGNLISSDQAYIREWSSAHAPAETDAAPAEEPSEFSKKVYKDLVYLKGSRLAQFKPEAGDSPKYFAFYRSALWCPPCRAFTPKLVKFYKKQKRRGAAFELVYISSDRNEDSMVEYMKDYDMPWPAFKYGTNKNIVTTKGGGIPNLIVSDADGKKLFGSYNDDGKYIGPTAVMNKLEELLKK